MGGVKSQGVKGEVSRSWKLLRHTYEDRQQTVGGQQVLIGVATVLAMNVDGRGERN